jgi:hypothetical protein
MAIEISTPTNNARQYLGAQAILARCALALASKIREVAAQTEVHFGMTGKPLRFVEPMYGNLCASPLLATETDDPKIVDGYAIHTRRYPSSVGEILVAERRLFRGKEIGRYVGRSAPIELRLSHHDGVPVTMTIPNRHGQAQVSEFSEIDGVLTPHSSAKAQLYGQSCSVIRAALTELSLNI